MLEVVKSLCHNFMVKDYVKQIESVQSVNLKREEFFLPASKVYLGPEAIARLFSLQGKDTKFTEKCKSIKEIAQKLYIEAVSQLVDRFPFDHDIYNFVEIVDPKVASDGDILSLRLFCQSSGTPRGILGWLKKSGGH